MEFKPQFAEWVDFNEYASDDSGEEDDIVWVTTDEWQAVFSEELWDFYAVLTEMAPLGAVSLFDVSKLSMEGVGKGPSSALARSLASCPGTWKFRDELWRLSDPEELEGFFARHSISSSS